MYIFIRGFLEHDQLRAFQVPILDAMVPKRFSGYSRFWDLRWGVQSPKPKSNIQSHKCRGGGKGGGSNFNQFFWWFSLKLCYEDQIEIDFENKYENALAQAISYSLWKVVDRAVQTISLR